MKFVLYTNIVSPHQLPLATRLKSLFGDDNFRYVYTTELPIDAKSRGWEWNNHFEWIVSAKYDADYASKLVQECDVLLSGIQDFELFETRQEKGLRTFYMSERWYKPFHGLPGWVRLFVPKYRSKVKRFVKWANTDPNARVLAIGPWAKKDFLRMGISLDKIVDWGYYVEPSHALPAEKSDGVLRLLWCGRLLGLKRVGDIVRAVGEHVGLKRGGISLTIVGEGPEKARLMKKAKGLPVMFMPGQPIEKIRELMREHDCYVLSSNAYEGWGAVVSEALAEGMDVVGTYEAGSSAAMLPESNLYHAGDWKSLYKIISERRYKHVDLSRKYSVCGAVETILSLSGGVTHER